MITTMISSSSSNIVVLVLFLLKKFPRGEQREEGEDLYLCFALRIEQDVDCSEELRGPDGKGELHLHTHARSRRAHANSDQIKSIQLRRLSSQFNFIFYGSDICDDFEGDMAWLRRKISALLRYLLFSTVHYYTLLFSTLFTRLHPTLLNSTLLGSVINSTQLFSAIYSAPLDSTLLYLGLCLRCFELNFSSEVVEAGQLKHALASAGFPTHCQLHANDGGSLTRETHTERETDREREIERERSGEERLRENYGKGWGKRDTK